LPRVAGRVPCDPEDLGGTSAADCSEFEHGYCRTVEAGDATSFCESGCVTDNERDAGFACICDDPDSPTGGRCKLSSCRTDAECDAGMLCASYTLCDETSFACQQPQDACVLDSDCGSELCLWNKFSGARECNSCGVP
jgi:hypothetical protein